ncbi:MAG TPA: hypothetical protein VNA28_14010 [Solirubrobacteraceae bacterium]|nr:hypothetical protein [Solirubrobacteraceae bacterium]
MVRLLAALVALAGAVVMPGAPAQAALETLVQDDASLLHRPTEQVRTSMQKLRSLGVDRVRLTANWSVLTREADAERMPLDFAPRDPAAYEQARWLALDEAVRLAQEIGLKVMIDIGFWAPHWAATDQPGPRARTNIDPSAFADFAVAVARRYSGTWTPFPVVLPIAPPSQDQSLLDGALGRRPAPPAPVAVPGAPLPAVDQFVLWNEPNHPSLLLPQWTGSPQRPHPASPGHYARMVRAAYPAAKAIRPDADFLLGNTSSDGGRPPSGSVAPLLFIRDMACVGGDLRPLRRAGCRNFHRLPGDGWAHHPYPRQVRPDDIGRTQRSDNVRIGNLDRLSVLLRRLAAAGRISKRLQRIHITEFGYETSRIPGRPTLSQATQARWLTWAEYLSSQVPGVVTFAQFLLRDQPPGPVRVSTSQRRGFGEYYTGLQTADGKDKLAAKSFTAGLFAQRLGERKVLLWGRLRLGSGPKKIAIQRRRGDEAWQKLTGLTVDGQDSFSLRTKYIPDARYRLRWPSGGTTVAGLPIEAVDAAREFPRR